MNIYRMNDCEWVAATTMKDAKRCLLEVTGQPPEYAFDNPCRLTSQELDTYTFHDEDGSERTFRQELNRRINLGDTFPDMFASAEY